MVSKFICVAITLFAINAFATSPARVAQNDQLAGKARRAVAEMAKTLKGELQIAMSQGGPANAIKVCREKAPQIAEAIGKRYGLIIDRTSLKPRRRTPDPWEKQVLMTFERRKSSGESVAALEHVEITENKGQPVLRYMKAIETKPVCLACHGERVAPQVEQALKALYPADQARGFNVGDIRGAFTVEIPLQDNPASP